MVTADVSLGPHSQIHGSPSLLQNFNSITALTPPEQDSVFLILTKLEKWAPILGRLRDEQAEKLAQWLDEKIERLMAWGPIGTDDQRCHVLERLTKLQEGPLSAHTILSRAIEQQVNALCQNLPTVNRRISDSDTIDSDGEWFGESGSEV